MIDNRAQAVIDKIPSNSKAQSKTNQGNDGDPFLPRIFDCLPWVIHLTLLHSSRTKVFLILLLVVNVNGRRVLGGAEGCCAEWIPWSGIDVVTARVAGRVEGTTSVWGLQWCLIW